jgi:TRAP-type C4-dicarboxylate transport system permease small subunit
VWAEELITMLFISTTYFGAVIGMKYKEHITIGFFYDMSKGKKKKVIDILNDIIILGLQIAIVYMSANWIDKVGNVLTNGLRVPIRFFYFMMPFSAGLIGLYCIFNIAGILSHWNESPADGVN